MTSLDLFESMHRLSAQMADLAEANDWDRLAAAEREMAALRNELARQEPMLRQAEALSDGELARKAQLITAMLANDRTVRQHVEPWLQSTRKLLSGAARGRAVRAAYGAHGP